MATNFYDPTRRTVFLRADASLYSRYHEEAHRAQHESGAIVYVAWALLRRIRFIGYLVTLWIEWDALRRARAVMQKLGVWTDEACQEGKANLRSYVACKPPVKACQSECFTK